MKRSGAVATETDSAPPAENSDDVKRSKYSNPNTPHSVIDRSISETNNPIKGTDNTATTSSNDKASATVSQTHSDTDNASAESGERTAAPKEVPSKAQNQIKAQDAKARAEAMLARFEPGIRLQVQWQLTENKTGENQTTIVWWGCSVVSQTGKVTKIRYDAQRGWEASERNVVIFKLGQLVVVVSCDTLCCCRCVTIYRQHPMLTNGNTQAIPQCIGTLHAKKKKNSRQNFPFKPSHPPSWSGPCSLNIHDTITYSSHVKLQATWAHRI